MANINYNAAADGNGMVRVTGTSLNSGDFLGIYANSAAVIASMTCSKITGSTSAIPVPAGSFLMFPGIASAITMTSGDVFLIKA